MTPNDCPAEINACLLAMREAYHEARYADYLEIEARLRDAIDRLARYADFELTNLKSIIAKHLDQAREEGRQEVWQEVRDDLARRSFEQAR